MEKKINKSQLTKIDGMMSLLKILGEDGFIKTVIENTYFFSPRLVHSRFEELSKLDEGGFITNSLKLPDLDGRAFKLNGTIFDDGYYYLLTCDKENERMRKYRIDRMERIGLLDEEIDSTPDSAVFDIGNYKKTMFGMFSGDLVQVTMEAESDLLNVIFDFGQNLPRKFFSLEKRGEIFVFYREKFGCFYAVIQSNNLFL